MHGQQNIKNNCEYSGRIPMFSLNNKAITEVNTVNRPKVNTVSSHPISIQDTPTEECLDCICSHQKQLLLFSNIL